MPERYDVVCLSHLRWDFVYQRPQHLLSRCARDRRVFVIEEPCWGDGPAELEIHSRPPGVQVIVPRLPASLRSESADAVQQRLLDELLAEQEIHAYVLWYYTPMALGFTAHLRPRATVYDCMDELAAFAGAPPLLRQREADLFARADLVFTGGHSLYEAKRSQHPRVYPFPSSVDAAHFEQARHPQEDPPDQAAIPHPRLGFFGVIDERMDRDLVAGIADARPHWQLVLIGPVTKIDAADLPRRPNIHYLGSKEYSALPWYLSGWDVALLPFARNQSTEYISPTKTPEYLAAGRPVVSTPIRDVVRPYGEQGLVHVADTPAAFVQAVERAMAEDRSSWLERVNAMLAHTSWDRTWARMAELLETTLAARAEGVPFNLNPPPAAYTQAEHRPGFERAGAAGASQPISQYKCLVRE